MTTMFCFSRSKLFFCFTCSLFTRVSNHHSYHHCSFQALFCQTVPQALFSWKENGLLFMNYHILAKNVPYDINLTLFSVNFCPLQIHISPSWHLMCFQFLTKVSRKWLDSVLNKIDRNRTYYMISKTYCINKHEFLSFFV